MTTGRTLAIAAVTLLVGVVAFEVWLWSRTPDEATSTASLVEPRRLVEVEPGTFAIADPGAGVVWRLTGGDLTIWQVDGLDKPSDVVVVNGSLLVSDSFLARIFRVDSSGAQAVAGSGQRGYSGDGGMAGAARLSRPVGLASDESGGYFIADEDACVVRHVDSHQRIDTVAGTGQCGYSGDGGPARSARLRAPGGVAFSGGTLYIADTDNGRVRQVEANGTITTVAGTGQRGFADGPAKAAIFNEPEGLIVFTSGELLVVDTDNNRVRRIHDGVVTTVAGTGRRGHTGDGGPALLAALNYPMGAAVSEGGILVADTSNAAVRRIDADTIQHVAGRRADGTLVREHLSVQAREHFLERARAGDSAVLKDLEDETGHRVPVGVRRALDSGNPQPLEAWMKAL